MTLKRRFIVLSLLLLVGTIVLSYFVVQRYHSKIPVLNRMFSSETNSTNTVVFPYEGLQPESNDPNGIYYENRVIVLMYHDLDPDPIEVSTLSVANFEKQLELMRDNNFHWITMSQYRDFILHSAPVPVNAVLLTFDDGYESLYKYAYPILQKYQAPASSFLIVNSIDNPKHYGMKKVSWEQVQLMQKNGIEFFSHTYDSHTYLPADESNEKQVAMLADKIYLKDQKRQETEQEYVQRVTKDLSEANDLLHEKLGIQNNVLAFPFGGFSKSLLKVCKDLGIDITLTVKAGINKPGQYNGFRVNAGGMTNDPVLQLSLMKHGKKLLGGIHFDDTAKARHYTLSSFVVLVVIGAVWLWTAIRLIAARRRQLRA
ncbi:biofilm PGA synthesis lipoprotein PgaB [Paenibacillus castaneae]|uniref:polysaccharide deacetylase family protein n=1 Tax=Paenibacillus castaneae TaxID=474957 RepID=UPI000C9BDB89|nr:polysaccharide deacetylase family protein [Paenibacillus castaneae]NIK78037.1 biofilm PGA synthesis lipoprotein PgaB [Paenibacillus castaneae]